MISNATRPLKPPVLDRYEIQKPIGSGSSGTVFRAYDRRSGHLVAIKVLSFKRAENPAIYDRLVHAFRAAIELEHPNIVRAISVENAGELCYLVSELIEAGNLGTRLDQHGRLPEDAAIPIATQIAQALHYAHQRQFFHGNVKPSNILLLPGGKAKLTDFGHAHYHENASPDQTYHSNVHIPPHFMPPEQVADHKNANARCDVYSLAATLYYAITGKSPFEAKANHGSPGNKRRGRQSSAWSLLPGVSERVEVAIRTALDPNPDRRPASCLEFFKLLTRRRVKENSGGTSAQFPSLVAPNNDRRRSVRYKLRVGSYGVVGTDIHAGELEDIWPLVVQDVSAGGIGVQLARRFEPGTELHIELVVTSGTPPQRLSLRVVRVQPERAGHWIHGCIFECPLTDAQLKGLLKFA